MLDGCIEGVFNDVVIAMARTPLSPLHSREDVTFSVMPFMLFVHKAYCLNNDRAKDMKDMAVKLFTHCKGLLLMETGLTDGYVTEKGNDLIVTTDGNESLFGRRFVSRGKQFNGFEVMSYTSELDSGLDIAYDANPPRFPLNKQIMVHVLITFKQDDISQDGGLWVDSIALRRMGRRVVEQTPAYMYLLCKVQDRAAKGQTASTYSWNVLPVTWSIISSRFIHLGVLARLRACNHIIYKIANAAKEMVKRDERARSKKVSSMRVVIPMLQGVGMFCPGYHDYPRPLTEMWNHLIERTYVAPDTEIGACVNINPMAASIALGWR
jgi:hypothetical protein